jgi:catechol 2,3-dioxygenase-like lactoylglutathione lyase family enzyme
VLTQAADTAEQHPGGRVGGRQQPVSGGQPAPAPDVENGLTLRTPDGHGRIELAMFHKPKAISAGPKDAPANTLGIRRIMFAVDDIEDVVARLRTHGAELVGELAQYEDSYRLCFVRGPEGIILGLAEQLS